MPTDGTGTNRSETGGNGQGNLLADPRWLAAGAGGLVSACLALWAFRGLPLGPFAFWLAPAPLFLAGLGFGALPAIGAGVVATLALAVSGVPVGIWLYGLGFALPVALLVAAWSRGGFALPLALLGILPAAGIVLAAIWLGDHPGGLEGVLRALAASTLRRFDLPSHAGLVSDIVRVKSAAIGFWLALALLANAWIAVRVLVRLDLADRPRWSAARLPGWYIALPALAFGAWMADDEGDAVTLSILLVLLVPLLLHGLAALHTRTAGLGERPLLLGALYVALVVLFLPASLAVAGYGAFDLLRPGGGRGAPPPPRNPLN
jgi:hypothetical protein